MAPVTAVATRPLQSSSGIPSRVDARQLDELLAGMLLDIENIPDLHPGQTPGPDIDSIRCPDLTWNSSRGRSSSSRSGGNQITTVNGYGGSHHHGGGSNHDSMLDTSLSLSNTDDAPYHTRMDSRPFSYGAVTSSPVLPRRRSPSPNSSPNRRPSREPMISRTGLESPRLVRRMSGSVGAITTNSNTINNTSSINNHTSTITDTSGVVSSNIASVIGNHSNHSNHSNHNNHSNHTNHSNHSNHNNHRRSPSPSPEPGSRGSTLRRERSQTLTNRIMAGEPSPPTTLTRSHVTRSASRLDDPDTIFSPDTLSRSLSGTSGSWLATQQRKLIERREAGRRADRGRNEARVMSELRNRIGQESAITQLQSAPHGHVNYYPSSSPNDGLLTTMHQQSGDELTWQSDSEVVGGSSRPSSAHRPVTPGFPPSTPTTPYLNQGLPPKSPTMQRKEQPQLQQQQQQQTPISSYRSPSPQQPNGHASPAPSLYHGPSRRSSLSSLNDTTAAQDVIHSHPKFVKDISKFWYKPTISRDEAINILKCKAPGTFIVRDSNSFPGAFGLAVKVATPPPNVKTGTGDPANELVRHFLIEPTARGVRLKGCSNEPVFGSLSALVYQHSITALALPCRLSLPERDAAGPTTPTSSTNGSAAVDSSALLQQGAACTVLYLFSLDTESLTGPQAVRRAVSSLLGSNTVRPTPVHFKVSSAGITLTDNHRTLFFRQHFPVSNISHCGTDPDDRRWQHNSDSGEPLASLRMFGFVAKKGANRNQNQCHILAELEPEQPATAICNFVTKVMMTSANRVNLV